MPPNPNISAAYVAKFSSNGLLVNCALFGAGSEKGRAIAVNGPGSVYIAGETFSPNLFVSSGAFQHQKPSPTSDASVFVTRLDDPGLPVYSTYFSGSNGDTFATGISIDASQQVVHVAGFTSSTTLPGAPAIVPNPTAGFVTKFAPFLTGIDYTQFLGAQINGFAVTQSTSRFPILSHPILYTAGYRFTGSNVDAFVVKLDESAVILTTPFSLGLAGRWRGVVVLRHRTLSAELLMVTAGRCCCGAGLLSFSNRKSEESDGSRTSAARPARIDCSLMTRRDALICIGATLARLADALPVNRNVRWALGSNLWNSYPGTRFVDILDVMHDTGFMGLRLTQYPQILEKYGITPGQLERELSARGLHVITISFNGAADDPAQHADVLARARNAMEFLRRFGADRLVVFSPRRGKPPEAFATMCRFYNELGEIAAEKGFKAGLHNHLGQMVQTPEEIDRCMQMMDPKLFYFSPDTAHVYLGGGDPAAILEKYKLRLMMADYKDAKRAGLGSNFVPNIFDLGDGEIDFPACHRVLRSINFEGWLCVDLDIARNGPLASYRRCGAYITRSLELIYA